MSVKYKCTIDQLHFKKIWNSIRSSLRFSRRRPGNSPTNSNLICYAWDDDLDHTHLSTPSLAQLFNHISPQPADQ